MLRKFKNRIKDLIVKEEWNIAIRTKEDKLLFESGGCEKPFKLLPNTLRYWAADPFIISKGDKDYLFFEMFDRFKSKGLIGLRIIENGKIGKMQVVFESLNIGKLGLALFIPLITCFISMVIPGSSIVVMFGSVFITLFASAGVNPLLVAGMLPCMCGVMCGITPPFALGMYAGMSIAKSDFSKTLKNDLWWVAVQYILEVVVLLELLPILGL